MFVHPPNLKGSVHAVLVTGPAQVWFAAAAAAAAGVSADRLLFLTDHPATPLKAAIVRIVQALGGVMWTDETSLAWFVRPPDSRVLWSNKTNIAYAVEAARRTQPGRVIQYADGFVAPLLAVPELGRWGDLDPDVVAAGTLKEFTPDLLALSNVFGNFRALPETSDIPAFEAPVEMSRLTLDAIRRRPAPGRPAGTCGLLLATSVHSKRYRVLHGKNAPGVSDGAFEADELRLYEALIRTLPPIDGRIVSLHPRTDPPVRAALEGLAQDAGWTVLPADTLAEEVLPEQGGLVIAPPSSILFTASRVCGARALLVGEALLDAYLGDWWRKTDLGPHEIGLCRAAGIQELGADIRLPDAAY